MDARHGSFEFLGYRFDRGRRWPRAQSEQKLKDTIRAHTRRANGHSLDQIITQVTRTLRGWYGYFKHVESYVFHDLDGWIRMRLRSILRKRRGLKGRGRGADHQRWSNAFFAKRGLFSLRATYALELRQSSRR